MNSERFEKEYKELKQQAKKYYNENVKDKLEELEKTRFDDIFIVIILYILLAFLLYLFIINFIRIEDKVVFWIVTIPLSFLLLVFYKLLAGHLNYLYKKKIKILYPLFLKQFHLKYKKDTNSNSIQHVINDSKLLYQSNAIATDDRFIGNYNDVDVEIAEITLRRKIETSNGDDVAFSSSFKGLAITFDSNKKIKALTHIKPKLHNLSLLPKIGFTEFVMLGVAGSHFLFGIFIIICGPFFHDGPPFWLGIPFIFWPTIFFYFIYKGYYNRKKIKNKKQKFQPVKIEDVVFSKYYDVYSYDQIESRYLLTTAFIERFMFLKEVFKTKNVCCAFVDDKILLLISSKKNLFEIGNLFTSLKNPKYVEKFYDEIIAILLLVNHFKLNEHTGL